MKLKNFCGYGTINAKKITKNTYNGETVLSVLVTGNHEQGLIPYYISSYNDYLMKKWLIERFDKSTKDISKLNHYTVAEYINIECTAAQYTFVYMV